MTDVTKIQYNYKISKSNHIATENSLLSIASRGDTHNATIQRRLI